MAQSSRNQRVSSALHPVRPAPRHQIVLTRSGSSLGYRYSPLGRAISFAQVPGVFLVQWLAKPTPRAVEPLWSRLCRAEAARTTVSTRHPLRAIVVPLA